MPHHTLGVDKGIVQESRVIDDGAIEVRQLIHLFGGKTRVEEVVAFRHHLQLIQKLLSGSESEAKKVITTLLQRKRSVSFAERTTNNHANTGTASKGTLGNVLRGWVERVPMGFSKCIDSTLNRTELCLPWLTIH